MPRQGCHGYMNAVMDELLAIYPAGVSNNLESEKFALI